MKTRKNIKIRLINNGDMTEWRSYGIKLHKMLMENPPEQVMIRLRDFYPDTSDHVTQIVDFPVFHVLSRETILRENAQKKEISRHIDKREMDDNLLSAEALFLADSSEDEYIYDQAIKEIICSCSAVQRQRFSLHIFGFSFTEIAQIQQCHESSVRESVKAVIKKIKNYLEATPESGQLQSYMVEGLKPGH